MLVEKKHNIKIQSRRDDILVEKDPTPKQKSR